MVSMKFNVQYLQRVLKMSTVSKHTSFQLRMPVASGCISHVLFSTVQHDASIVRVIG